MKTNYTAVLSLGCLCLVLADIPGISVQAKSIEELVRTSASQTKAHSPHVIHKRNAWWSKKSSLPATELDHLPPHNLAERLLSGGSMGPMHRRAGGAWWSKKSAGFAEGPEGQWEQNNQVINRVSAATARVLDNQIGSQHREEIECYSNRCVTDLVMCQLQLQHSEPLSMDCQLRHRLCADKCFQVADPLLD